MTLLLWLACTGITAVPDQLGKGTGDSGTTGDTAETAVNGQISVQPSNLDFGTVNLGQSADEDVTVTNVGDKPLSIQVSLKGDSVFSPSTTSVDLDSEEVITLSFSPTAEKSYTGTLKIDAGDGGLVSVPVTGEGLKAEVTTGISATPNQIDYGQVDVGTTASQTLLIENTGTQDLLISDIRYGDSTLSFGGGSISLPQIISSGKNKALTVNFTPSAEKTYNSTVTIISDDAGTPRLEIPTSGEGLHSCSICSPILTADTGGSDPYGLSFGPIITAFGNSETKTVTITNDGDQTLDVSSMSITNDFLASCGTFTLKNWNGSKSLAPNKSFNVDVTLKVTGSCLEVDQASAGFNVLEIRSNDPGANPYVISLTGSAL